MSLRRPGVLYLGLSRNTEPAQLLALSGCFPAGRMAKLE